MPISPPSTIADQVPVQNLSLNEKRSDFYAASPSPALPPPAYATSTVPTIATASAVYEYKPTDAGDLPLLPNDRISVTEFMNTDWAKGRNERTGAEGIFPRSFIKLLDEKPNSSGPPPHAPSNYGNMPLDVSQGGSGGAGAAEGKESKFNQNGKKFGKKMGNAGESSGQTDIPDCALRLLTLVQLYSEPALPLALRLSMGYSSPPYFIRGHGIRLGSGT